MELNGTVELIFATETVGANGFQKRLLLLETDEQFKQKLPIEFIKDKCSVLDNYKVGDKVKVSINLRGSEYNGRYYSQIQGWQIRKAENAPSQQPENNF